MRRLVLSVVFVSLSLIAGCKKKSGDAALIDSDARETMGNYAGFFNETLAVGKASRDYFSSIPEDTTNFAEAHNIWKSPDDSAAVAALKVAKDGAPEALKHLAPMADALATAADEVRAANNEAQKYYQAQDFKDDKGAKGAAIHAKMITAAGHYREAISKFEAALTTIEDKQAEAELADFADSKDQRYHYRKLLVDAKKVLTAADKDDAALLKVKTELLATEIAVATALPKDSVHAAFTGFVESANKLQGDAKKLQRALTDKNDAEIDSSYRAMVADYNGMISVSDGLRTLEKAGQL